MWRAIVSKNALVVLWSASAVVGAFGATFAMRHRTPGLARQAVRCVGTAGALGAAMMFLWAIVTHRAAGRTVHFDMLGGLRWLALYFPACFALEEVAFRGAVDAHLSPDARWNASSAFLSSALWGAWHLPIQVGRGSVVAALIALLVVHLPVGMLLAMGWRRSGNLVPSALAHAVIDAVRNAMVTP
jgi:membrane protease YdiL (CAAX protease family)